MKNYRIVKRGKFYYPQFSGLFGWWHYFGHEKTGDDLHYNTVEEAENFIKEQLEENDFKIIKTYL